MRKIYVETIEPGETEVEVFVSELNAKEMALLTDFGMNLHDLLLNEKTEFLSPGGAQYRVTLCPLHSFINDKGGNA